IEKLTAIATPARVGASGVRDLNAASTRWKRGRINLTGAAFVARVGEPFAIRRDGPILFTGRRIENGKRFVRRGDRQGVDVHLRFWIDDFVNHVSPVGRDRRWIVLLID